MLFHLFWVGGLSLNPDCYMWHCLHGFLTGQLQIASIALTCWLIHGKIALMQELIAGKKARQAGNVSAFLRSTNWGKVHFKGLGHCLALVGVLFVLKCLALFCFLGSGVSHVLTLALQELSLLCKRDVNGVGVLYELLRSRWLQALLKVSYHTAGRARSPTEQSLGNSYLILPYEDNKCLFTLSADSLDVNSNISSHTRWNLLCLKGK